MHNQQGSGLFARLKHLKREPLPDKEVRYLTKVALGKRVWGKSPLLHERYSKDEEDKKKAIQKIGEMAEAGYDCSAAKTALDVIVNNQDPVLQGVALKTRLMVELAKPIVYDTEKTCKQLTEFVALMEARGLGKIGSLLVVDRKTMDAFFRFGHGAFKPLGFPFTLFVHRDRPEDLRDEANGGGPIILGRINLWGTLLDLEQNGVQKILAHELVHSHLKNMVCMLGLQKLYWKEHSRIAGSMLLRTINEGFADFAAYILINHPEKEGEFQRAVQFTAQNLVDLPEGTANIELARRAGFFDGRMEEMLYLIGLNFFVKASELLGEKPMEYLDILEKTPPTAIEIFSKQGGRKWAERVFGRAAENTTKTAHQTH